MDDTYVDTVERNVIRAQLNGIRLVAAHCAVRVAVQHCRTNIRRVEALGFAVSFFSNIACMLQTNDRQRPLAPYGFVGERCLPR